MPDDDDEITVDFDRMKKWFGKKPHKEHEEQNAHAEKVEHKPEEKSHHEHAHNISKRERIEKEHAKKEEPVMHQIHAAEKIEDKKEDDESEINFDFGKVQKSVAGMFKGGKKEKDDEDVSVDLAPAMSMAKKHRNILLPLLAVIIIIWISSSVRLQPMDLPIADDQWAPQSVFNTIQQDVQASVQQQFPNLPHENLQQLISEEIANVQSSGQYTFRTGQFAGQTIDVQQQIDATADNFKQFFQRDDNDQLYMQDIDTYYWYRYAQNIVETGMIGDEIKEGRQWDNHQVAPFGRGIGKTDQFHPFFIANWFKFLKVFFPNITLMWAMMWYPVVISAASAVMIFFIGRRLVGNVAGFFAGAIAAVNTSFLTRTFFGHADSDAWVIFFSVLVFWLVIEAFSAKKFIPRILIAAGAGLAVGLFSNNWGGWWYVFDLMLVGMGLFVAFQVAGHYQSILKHGPATLLRYSALRNAVVIGFVFVIASAIFVTIFNSFTQFIIGPISPVTTFSEFKTPVLQNLWPNVLTTVAELNPGSIPAAISATGGKSLFVMALVGIAFTLMKTKGTNMIDVAYIVAASIYYYIVTELALSGRFDSLTPFFIFLALPLVARVGVSFFLETERERMNIDTKTAAFLIIWFMVTIMATTQGIRFTLMLIPAFSVAFGVFMGKIHGYLSTSLSSMLKVERMIIAALIFLVLLSVFFFPNNMYENARGIARQDVPLINDAWFNSLDNIRQTTDEDAIISSWWDFGHHFKALADRAVTFDGTTQQTPQAHWIGKILSTDDEELAMGMLRMLHCGRNRAIDTLTEETQDVVVSRNLMDGIFKLSKEDGQDFLRAQGISESTITGMEPWMYCNPPESVFIASEDMIGKSGVWAHFGAWNFTRADIAKNTRSMNREEAIAYMDDKFDIPREEANQLHNEVQNFADDRAENTWVAPWPSYSNNINRCQEQGEILLCSDGLNINLTTLDAWYVAPQGNLHPVDFYFFDPVTREMNKKTYTENVMPQRLSVVAYPGGGEYVSIIASPEIAGGMFTRMFYMEGDGLTYFRQISHERSLTGLDIYVYTIQWENGQPIAVADLVQAERDARADVEMENGNRVTISYIGYFEDGTIFDSSINDWQNEGITPDSDFADYLSTPLNFELGTGEVIPGFNDGILGMKLDEIKIIEVPPEGGYPSGPLAGQTLYFKVRLEQYQ